ncbi:hypothetical protein MAR_025919 [Mya arenaria]|uniref:RNase H type-1 domain-containing protein n=1 Tax=Mya arenaria TaxID=6604 RepID=A0ABY7ES35_MYAAR|nr:hypothetical protein MAR_025919 [Mya arenaria]
MESLHAAMRLITPGCFWSRYLKDAYYTVNVSEEFRNYLRFIWRVQRGASLHGHSSDLTDNRCLFKRMGAVCKDNSTGGQWTVAQASFKDNINNLELNAVILGLKAYTLRLKDKHIRVRVENSTAVACINHMGVSDQNNAMILHV